MAYLPLQTPSNSPRRATPPLQSLFQSHPIQPSEVSVLFAELRQILAGGTQSLDSILGAVTDAALVMTGASGIALALRGDGIVICRARAGEIAPHLGGRLNGDSGISGECLRTGKALRCDDTQTDDRVDPEVCRVLGIRSIAVVPVHGREGTVGILEALSSRTHAFTGEHLSLLECLAEIGEVASDRELGADLEARGSVPPEIPDKFVRPELAAASAPDESWMANLFGERPLKGRRSYWTIAGIALALILLSAVIWISLSDTHGEVVSSEQATQSQTTPQENPSQPAPTAIPWKPTASRARVRVDGLGVKGAFHNATTVEPEPLAPSEVPSSSLKIAGASAPQPSPTPEISIQLPPEVGAYAPDTAGITALVSTPATLPAADLAISRGVTEATLVHNVLPVYPSQARARHLGGSVVLAATIAEDGSTRDLKVISGSPMLAKAATEAVRQWRYHPSLLNGKPVAVQKQITIVFKNP